MKKAFFVLLAIILMAQSAVVLAEKQVFAYQGDVAFFEENGLMGLQDKAGNVLHKAEFVSACPFDVNNLAHVYLTDGSQGYINRAGQYAIQPIQVSDMGYKRIGESIAWHVMEIGYTQKTEAIIPDRIFYTIKNKMGMLSLNGETLLPIGYRDIYPVAKNKNMAFGHMQWYLIDNQGNELSDLHFDWVDKENLLGIAGDADSRRYYTLDGICIYEKTPQGIRYADQQGNPIDVSGWDELYIGKEYKDGYVAGRKGDKWGVMDIQGKTVVAPKWYSVSLYNWETDDDPNYNSRYYLLKEAQSGGNTYIYDNKTKETKKLILQNDAMQLVYFDSDYIAYRNENTRTWGYMDYNGKTLSEISDQYRTHIHADLSEGYHWAIKEGQPYFFDMYGNSITSEDWQMADDFAEGFAAVKIKDKWGFINKKGETVIAPIWDDVNSFSSAEGQTVALVWKDGGPYGWINTKGELLCLYKR